MSSLFGSVRSPTDTPSNPAGSSLSYAISPSHLTPFPPDYAARLERIKASVRDSLALQNYQELMTVGDQCLTRELLPHVYTESWREVLCQVHHEAWDFLVQF